SFKTDDGSMPDELIKLSFLRGSFCAELLEFADDMPISRSEAYLMGMFSTLGKLMQMPLDEVLAQIPISDDIKNALISHEGRSGMLYDTVLAYENADWTNMKNLAEGLGIPKEMISEKYCECVQSVNSTWDKLMQATDYGDEEEEEK
ncbi:MAG: diguanylate phosphodiesterase, partial [Oscillospiraceae bacterium]|nr:diguanylate phosphodiesterase [Oscillospiraceae bacterium]